MENLKTSFLGKAYSVHGNKWDYSKVNYTNKLTKIIIICPIHGEFKQTPRAHLKSKYPCPKCLPPHCIPNPNSKTALQKKNKPPKPLSLPDEIINGKNIWIRYCPKCHKKIICKTKDRKTYGNKNNTCCLSCKNIGRIPSNETKNKWSIAQKNYWNNKKRGIIINQYMNGRVYYNEHGIWCRICPQCRQEMEYARKENAIESEKSNRKCAKCVGKGGKIIHKRNETTTTGLFLNSLKQWCRKCPRCGKEIQYSSEYWAKKAQKTEAICCICHSTLMSSKGEKLFLDYFNINVRQQQIGNYLVDGLKNNVIYEFLGDFWHGHPKQYNPNRINPASGETFGKLYEDTIRRFKDLQSFGYNIKYIWESDWEEFKKDKLLDNSKFRYFNGIDLIS